MNTKRANLFCAAGILVYAFLAGPLRAQISAATLSGVITGPSGAPVANAKIAAKNVASGQTTEAQTDASGRYNLPNLPPGDYEVSATSDALGPKVSNVTLAAGARQTMDLALAAASTNVAPPPNLGDLGFPSEETKGSAQDQARLDKRSHMLKMHQRYGLITIAPLVATIATSGLAGGRHSTAVGRDVHGALGSLTADMYFMAAYYAIRAPRIAGTPTRGPIRLHKALAWVHGPGMILTPLLGAMAITQESQGEKVHGIAKLHSAVATVTYSAFGLAIASVTFKF